MLFTISDGRVLHNKSLLEENRVREPFFFPSFAFFFSQHDSDNEWERWREAFIEAEEEKQQKVGEVFV